MQGSNIETRLSDLESSIKNLKESPSQQLIERMTAILIQKLDDRDKIIDLELKNMSKSIKLDIQSELSKAHESLERKIDSKIIEAINNQKEKVSWGMEVLRFAIVAAMFLLSIKLMNP